MAGTNTFKTWDANNQNILSDGAYETDYSRLNGVRGGDIADPALHNKIFRQATIFAEAFGAVIAERELNATDVDVNQLKNAIIAAFSADKMGSASKEDLKKHVEDYKDPHKMSLDNGVVTIEGGGHGGKTPAEARENLGITPANIGALPADGGPMTGSLTLASIDESLASGHSAGVIADQYMRLRFKPTAQNYNYWGVMPSAGESAIFKVYHEPTVGVNRVFVGDDPVLHRGNLRRGTAGISIPIMAAGETVLINVPYGHTFPAPAQPVGLVINQQWGALSFRIGATAYTATGFTLAVNAPEGTVAGTFYLYWTATCI